MSRGRNSRQTKTSGGHARSLSAQHSDDTPDELSAPAEADWSLGDMPLIDTERQMGVISALAEAKVGQVWLMEDRDDENAVIYNSIKWLVVIVGFVGRDSWNNWRCYLLDSNRPQERGRMMHAFPKGWSSCELVCDV